MKYFLVGYMGSGKSTFGQVLAQRAGLLFLDLDELIESEVGMTISKYFDQHGEAAFRALEKKMLDKLEAIDQAVIATGGGMPCFGDNMDRLNALGTTVYLEVSEEELAQRLLPQRAGRPLIAGKNESELRAFIREHLGVRKVHYEKANITIDGTRPEDQLELFLKV